MPPVYTLALDPEAIQTLVMPQQRIQNKVKLTHLVIRIQIVKMLEPGHFHSRLNTSEEATCPLSAVPLPR